MERKFQAGEQRRCFCFKPGSVGEAAELDKIAFTRGLEWSEAEGQDGFRVVEGKN